MKRKNYIKNYDPDKKNRSKAVLLGVILFLVVGLIALGISYAYYTVSMNTAALTTSTATATLPCIELSSYSEGNVINLTNTYPMTDAYALSNLTPLTITITNNCTTGTTPITFTLTSLRPSSATSYIPDSKIRVRLRQKVGSGSWTDAVSARYVSGGLTAISSGAVYTGVNALFSAAPYSSYPSRTMYRLAKVSIASGTTVTYRVYVYVDWYEGDTTHAGVNDNTTKNMYYKYAIHAVVNGET